MQQPPHLWRFVSFVFCCSRSHAAVVVAVIFLTRQVIHFNVAFSCSFLYASVCTHTHTHTHALTHTHSLTHSLTHALTHTHCMCCFAASSFRMAQAARAEPSYSKVYNHVPQGTPGSDGAILQNRLNRGGAVKRPEVSSQQRIQTTMQLFQQLDSPMPALTTFFISLCLSLSCNR